MISKRILATFAVAGALTVAGCGSDDENTADTAASNPATPAASVDAPATSVAEPAAGAGEEVAVGIKNIQFDPKQVTVKAGQKITWTNNEPIEHNVVATDGADFESDTLGEGDTFTFTPTEPGTIAYECTLHPGQTGSITVQ